MQLTDLSICACPKITDKVTHSPPTIQPSGHPATWCYHLVMLPYTLVRLSLLSGASGHRPSGLTLRRPGEHTVLRPLCHTSLLAVRFLRLSPPPSAYLRTSAQQPAVG